MPINEKLRRYFRYRFKGEIFQWRVLPFGFRDAPRLFQKLIIEAVSPLRRVGVKLVVYLDDILVVGESKGSCADQVARLTLSLLSLGFIINIKKSSLTPSQSIEFLGTHLDTMKMVISLPQEKLRVFRARVAAMLRKYRLEKEATLHEIQSIVGTIGSMSDCIQAVRVHLNALMELQNKALHAKTGRVKLSGQAKMDLEWWKKNMAQWNGRSLLPVKTDVVIDVDASTWGMGVFYRNPQGKGERAHRFFSNNDTTHINCREMQAALFGLQTFREKYGWSNLAVKIRTDSMTSMAYINRMGGRIPRLARLAEKIHKYALEHGIKVVAEWIPGTENVEADQESRITNDFSGKSLSNLAFQQIEATFGPLDLDLFATALNTKCPAYVSLKPEPECLYEDAFSRPLPRDLRIYANPPFILLPRLLAKVLREEASIVLVAPVWTSQPWWPMLLQLLADPPPRVLPASHLYSSPSTAPPRWETIACLLSARSSGKRVSQKVSTTWWSLATSIPPMPKEPYEHTNELGKPL